MEDIANSHVKSYFNPAAISQRRTVKSVRRAGAARNSVPQPELRSSGNHEGESIRYRRAWIYRLTPGLTTAGTQPTVSRSLLRGNPND